MSIGYAALIAVLVAFSAFFSGSEIAYASANERRLRLAAEEKGSLADRLAYRIYQSYDDALTTILIGNNLVNIAASELATLIFVSLIGDAGALVSTLVMTIILLIFGEIVPKILATEIADVFARLVAVPLNALMIVTRPIVILVSALVKRASCLWRGRADDDQAVTEDDLEAIIETVEDEGVIDEATGDLLHSALDFGDVLAYEIITPRVDLFALDIDTPIDEVIAAAGNSQFTRVPVYEGTVDNIVGILHLNRLYRALVDGRANSLRELLMPVTFVHKTTPLDEVLKRMKQGKCHMVVVSDEYGGTMGVLTMEDVLEQLVGDIWDESDEIEDEFRELPGDLYEADGDMRIEDFFEELDVDMRDFDDDNATVGGWAIEMLGDYPNAGDSYTYKNLEITVKETQALRVVSLTARKLPDTKEDKGE